MSKKDKLIKKMNNFHAIWTWKELINLLIHLSYEQIEGAGSRVKFDNGNAKDLINLHKPHPNNEVKNYVVRQVREKLKQGNLL